MSDNEDLTNNPLDDFVPGPTVLDKASMAIADHIGNKYREAIEIIEQATESASKGVVETVEDIGIAIPKVNVKPTGISTYTHTANPFNSTCPDFEMGDVRQAILKHQWDICRNRWDYQQSYADRPAGNTDLQQVVFAIVVHMMARLSVEHFVAIQPTDHECSKIFYLEVQNAETDHHTQQTRVEMAIVSSVVTATQLKLQTYLTFEAFQDFNAAHGSDFSYELARVMAKEVERELYKEIYDRLYGTSYRVELEFQTDERTSIQLYKESIDIAKRSYRGYGNKLIVSNSVLASLLRAEAIEVIDDATKRYGVISYVGNLGNGMEVFSDSSMADHESVIVYKGGSGETDAGLIYSPYKMLVAGGVTVDPSTYQPPMPLYTQFSVHENNLSNYVTHIIFNNLGYTVEDDRMVTELFATKPISSALINVHSFYGSHTLK